MGYEEFSVSMTNRSLRTIKAELEFLTDNSAITRHQLSSILEQLPSETSLTGIAAAPPTNSLSSLSLSNGARNEKANSPFAEPPSYGATTGIHAPPPAAAAPIPAAPPVLAHAVSLYAYSGTDAGDLSLLANDHIAVTEYMNAEWWKGRNERTGQEGIFPRSYVRLEEKSVPQAHTPQPGGYGNMPVEVAQGQAGAAEDPKKKGTAAKLGGKLGNAAIFGAGATIGSNIVNSIF